MRQLFRPGTATWIASDSPSSSFSAVFEDDGSTAYLYAYDRHSGAGILDAVQIYNVGSAADPGRESQVEVQWSPDGLKAGLLLNGRLHAIIDFEARVAYCRSNYPLPGGAWAAAARAPWQDELAGLLR